MQTHQSHKYSQGRQILRFTANAPLIFNDSGQDPGQQNLMRSGQLFSFCFQKLDGNHLHPIFDKAEYAIRRNPADIRFYRCNSASV
jgi:hypothetical protein